MKIKLILFCAMIYFVSCTGSKTNLDSYNIDSYFGIDLKSKEWNYEYGMPLIYLKDEFPHIMPNFGGNIPKFILYENGNLIYGKIENDKLIYYEVILSDKEMNNIFKELNIPNHNFSEDNHLQTEYRGEPSTSILIINKNYSKIIKMTGRMEYINEKQKKKYKNFVKIYNNIINYKNQKAKEWLPDHIELVMWDWTNEPSSAFFVSLKEYKSINKWPNNFPDLFSTDKTYDYEYIFSFKKELFNDFYNFMFENFNEYYDYKTVIVNDKKLWLANFSGYIPLPNIKYWDNDW